MKRKGIALKTFVFTAAVLSFVIVLSFAALYYFLPHYYLYSKTTSIQKNTDLLVREIRSGDSEKVQEAISDFSLLNNANVYAYDEEGKILAEYSSPFMVSGDIVLSISYVGETAESPAVNEAVKSRRNITYAEETAEGYASVESRRDITRIIINDRGEQQLNSRFFVGAAESKDSIEIVNITKDVGGNLIQYIEVNGTLQPIDEAKGVILSLIPFLLGIDIFLACLAAYIYTKRLTSPILQMSVAAEQMQLLEPGVQSGIRTSDELGLLSENLDTLYGNLCQNIQNLQNEMAKVNQLEQSKTYFMNAASHELKTPIAALNGIIEGMLDNVGIYRNRDQYLQECKTLLNRLSGLVNEILQVAQLESAAVTLNQETVLLSDLVDYGLKINESIIEEKKLQICYQPGPMKMETDREMLFTVLSNLISNAVQYTNPGGQVEILFKDTEDKRSLLIRNECHTVLEEQTEKLFEPFYTLDYSRNRSRSGTGLGLYIVKRNLELLGISYQVDLFENSFCFEMFFT